VLHAWAAGAGIDPPAHSWVFLPCVVLVEVHCSSHEKALLLEDNRRFEIARPCSASVGHSE
jgi:hypothetical protein